MINHQPYLFKKDNNNFLLLTKGGEPTLFYNGNKISFESIFVRNLSNNEEKKLFNFIDQIECNPVYFEENNKKYISYIKSHSITSENIETYNPLNAFSLFKVEIDDNFNVIGEHTLVHASSYSGFENHKFIIHSSLNINQIVLNVYDKLLSNNFNLNISQFVAFHPFFRVIPVFQYENSVILTSAALEDSILIYDIHDIYNFKRIVNKDKMKIYKCSFLEDLLVYAIKTGEDFEDRDLVFENNFSINL
jgi:hypothetical protein